MKHLIITFVLFISLFSSLKTENLDEIKVKFFLINTMTEKNIDDLKTTLKEEKITLHISQILRNENGKIKLITGKVIFSEEVEASFSSISFQKLVIINQSNKKGVEIR